MLRRVAAGSARVRRHRLLLPAGLALAFAAVASVVLSRSGVPYPFDTGPQRWSAAHRTPTTASAVRYVTDAGAGPFTPVAAALGGWLAGRGATRRRLVAAALAELVFLAGQALRGALMNAANRPRPPAAQWAVQVSGSSFPSGHTTSSAMAAGLLGWGLLRALPGAAGRLLAGLGVAVAVAVGCSRVYLGVHWPSDVLAGWLLAAFWLALTLPPLTGYLDRGGGPAGDRGTAAAGRL